MTPNNLEKCIKENNLKNIKAVVTMYLEVTQKMLKNFIS